MPKQSVTPDLDTDPNRSTSPAFFQCLGSLDLFNNLLFNREKVYQSFKRLSPIRTGAAREEQSPSSQSIRDEDRVLPSTEPKDGDTEDCSMLSYLKCTETAVSKPRGKPPKKAPAKAKPKESLGLATTRKRSAPVASKTERASKTRKTVPKANSGKRVNGRGASVTDRFVISDDDDDDLGPPRQKSRTHSITPPRQMLKIDAPSSEEDLNLTFCYSNNIDYDLQNEIVRNKVAHSEELAKLWQQLNASEAKVKQIKEDAEREIKEQQRRQSVGRDKYMADFEEELETEKRRSSDLSWECDHLRKEMEAARSCLKGEADLMQERDKYERLHKEEQDTNANLMRGLAEKDEEFTRKAAEMAKEIQRLAEQIEALQLEVTDLKTESASLSASAFIQTSITDPRGASPSSSQSSTSALQLSTATDAEQRLANIRRTYITVKKRYDNLHSVATNISTTTRTWDYGSFGEFGQYLRQLRTALDENEPEDQTTAGPTSSRGARVD